MNEYEQRIQSYIDKGFWVISDEENKTYLQNRSGRKVVVKRLEDTNNQTPQTQNKIA